MIFIIIQSIIHETKKQIYSIRLFRCSIEWRDLKGLKNSVFLNSRFGRNEVVKKIVCIIIYHLKLCRPNPFNKEDSLLQGKH